MRQIAAIIVIILISSISAASTNKKFDLDLEGRLANRVYFQSRLRNFLAFLKNLTEKKLPKQPEPASEYIVGVG